MTERFDADWLALRERFDHAARSVALARRLADALPARRPRLVDLGAGAGSLFRFLAPIIGRGQDWILIDADADVLDDAFGRTAAWARRQGFAATAQGDVLSVATPRGLWRMEARLSDLTQFRSVEETYRRAERSDTDEGVRLAATPSPGASRRPLPQAGEAYGVPEADAVLCSALLDLVSRRWLLGLLDTLRMPFLACLTVDGRDVWLPRHPADSIIRAAFRRDQRRDKGFGSALGVAAPSATLGGLAACGFATVSAPSDWHIPRTALRMQRALIEGIADAARNADPARDAAITAWEAARLHQAVRGRLAIRIGHRDILGLPQGG